MHRQSAGTENSQDEFTQLSPIFLLNPVHFLWGVYLSNDELYISIADYVDGRQGDIEGDQQEEPRGDQRRPQAPRCHLGQRPRQRLRSEKGLPRAVLGTQSGHYTSKNTELEIIL